MKYKKVFFVIQCPQCEAHKAGHWTLLVRDSQGAAATEGVAVRYYDTLSQENEVCRARAGMILRNALGVEATDEVERCLSRQHLFRQTGTECGLWAMHYLELEVRQMSDEGGAPVTTPKTRGRAMREKCASAARQLEKARGEWLQAAMFEEAKAAVVMAAL